MDCNREEAIRAKAIAEKKMETKDFFGAKKVAQKAQQLYPDLENISQMIIVCDVHCSSQNTVYGNEKDWYAILKVEPTADELSIKKQYRKLALLLHPDKNKFAGSDDAFKLIGEAQRVLLDRDKRMLHDSKRKATGRSAAPNWAPRQPTRHSNTGQQAWARTTFTPVNTQAPPQQSETGRNEKSPTFWTACPFCLVRYEFYRSVINKLLSCQRCKKSFTGYEMNAQGVAAPATNWPPPWVPVNGGPQGTSLNPNSNAGVQGKTVGENSRNSFAKTHSEVSEGSIPKEGQPNGRKSHGKANGRRRKQVVESSESCDSESSTDLEDDEVIKEDLEHPTSQDFQYYSEQPRRSSRSKRSVSYNEKNLNDDDDDDENPSKKAKQEAEYPSQKEEKSPDERELQQEKQHFAADSQNGEKKTQKEDEKETPAKMVAETETETEAEPEIYECPDPDFSDFDKDKKEEVFDVGQMWAVYDTQDAMPRFYARIRKVSPNFKLQITWLEPDPDDEDDINWVYADLPVSCGKFKRGNPDKAEDHPMFSHLVNWEKGSKRETFKIYPRKGQTWALYKNWDTLRKWSSSNPDIPDVGSDERMKYEYEFVEILTNYDDSVGISVAYLGKVKGFSCLFGRKAEQEGGGMVSLVTIPPKELYRFSHRVPSFQMTGEEREGVPKGSFELDPAALPPNLEV